MVYIACFSVAAVQSQGRDNTAERESNTQEKKTRQKKPSQAVNKAINQLEDRVIPSEENPKNATRKKRRSPSEAPYDPFVDIDLNEPNEAKGFNHLYLYVSKKNMEILKKKRSQALKEGLLKTSDADFVKGEIRLNDGKKKGIRLRLKGDYIEHLEDYKWSFRIKVRGANTLLGMKNFSVQHPKTRAYVREWLFHQMLKQEDIVNLRYDFIKLSLNGQYVGMFAMEEHFDKRLIEHNRRREGPILKFNEDGLWENYINTVYKTGEKVYPDDIIYKKSVIEGFKLNTLKSNPQQYRYYEKSKTALESFRNGELPAWAVFDIDRMARFYALSYVIGQTHGLRWHNQRFYYNPITMKLEPIGFDAEPNAGYRGKYDFIKDNKLLDEFSRQLFSSHEFLIAFIRELRRIGNRKYTDAFISKTKKQAELYTSALIKEFHYLSDPFIGFKENIGIFDTVFDIDGQVFAYIHAVNERDDGKFEFKIKVLNKSKLPIVISGLKSKKDRLNVRYIVIPTNKPTQYHFYETSFISEVKIKGQPELIYKLAGEDREYSTQVQQVKHFEVNYKNSGKMVMNMYPKNTPRGAARGLTNSLRVGTLKDENYPFLKVYEGSRTILFKSGKWTLDRHLIIPAGYRVMGESNMNIDMINGAAIISFSPVEFRGTSRAPIVFNSPDNSSQGFIVISAGTESILEYVQFEALRSMNHEGWELTGSVVFYESPVVIKHTTFSRNRSEDGLNIIRSDYNMNSITIQHTQSDAFDADFSNGSITDSYFVDCGNDCIDVSGSDVTIERVNIENVGDKGVSIGESSVAKMNTVSIANGKIGIASKDRSDVNGNNIHLSDLTIGLTVYQKKPEFGPSSLTVNKLQSSGLDIPFLIETNSQITVEGIVKKQIGKTKANFIIDQVKQSAELN